jgi:hypothetical protein
VSRLVAGGRTADAQAIADDISARDPDAGAVATHLVEFHEKRLAMPTDKPLEKYKLAAWARQMGLLEEARPLFAELRNDPRFAANAQLQLDLIENARCTEQVNYLRQLYDENDFQTLEAEVQKFESSAPPAAFAQKARDLLQLAKFQKWSSGKVATGKAEAEFQQAERLANRREFDAALLHLNRVQMETGSSDAAVKARVLRDKIMRAKRLDAMEKQRGGL